MTLVLIQSHRSTRQQELVHQLSQKVLYRFRWNFGFCRDLLLWGISYSLISRNQYSRGGTLLVWFYQFSIGLHSDIYWPISVKLGMRIEIIKQFVFIPVLKIMTFIQVRVVSKLQTYDSFSIKFLSWLEWNVYHAATDCWFAETCQTYFAQLVFKGENSTNIVTSYIPLTLFYVRPLMNLFVTNLNTTSNTTKVHLKSTVWF